MSETTTAHQLSTAPTRLPASPTRSHVRSLARCESARTHQELPRVFTLRGHDWDLLDEVFAPDLSPSTETALDFLGLSAPYGPLGPGPAPMSRGRMLEIGSGAGVISVLAALSGYDRVVAADVNQHAVRNSELNIARHGVGDRVRAVHSDLFSGLAPAERFDTVFWSSNYVLAPEDYVYRNDCEQAFVDPGYAAHRRFLEEAGDWTTPDGAVLLHFSSRGELPLLRRLAASCGRSLLVRRSQEVREGEELVEHLLLEVTPAP
ncbi:methyltransferase [Streptomyces sioyaensis]|uniref:methyltransferase n=1 Tax=Streptomyces sioyaensis TaxID=67364 RepID=UPI0037A14FF8